MLFMVAVVVASIFTETQPHHRRYLPLCCDYLKNDPVKPERRVGVHHQSKISDAPVIIGQSTCPAQRSGKRPGMPAIATNDALLFGHQPVNASLNTFCVRHVAPPRRRSKGYAVELCKPRPFNDTSSVRRATCR